MEVQTKETTVKDFRAKELKAKKTKPICINAAKSLEQDKKEQYKKKRSFEKKRSEKTPRPLTTTLLIPQK